MSVRHKVTVKCDCGQAVAIGSVFCPHCRAAINRKNVKTMKKEERRYQKKVHSKGKGKGKGKKK